jgi:hypothetical protein
MRNLLLAATAAAAIAAPAAATTTYNFNLTGSYTATWSMPVSPTPTYAFNPLAVFTGITFTQPGNVAQTADLLIFPSSTGGGIAIYTAGGKTLYFGSGGEIFTGAITTPTFKTGTFAFFDADNVQNGTLTISAPSVGGVPEPASWAMLIAGFGLSGAAMRRRRAGATTA